MPGQQPRKPRAIATRACALALVAALVPVAARASEALSPLGATLAQHAPPVDVTPPHVAGVLRAGRRLHASNGRWTGRPGSYEYGWRRCGPARCRPIAGATGAAYTLREADAGRALQVAVVAVNSAGRSAPALSPATAVVAGTHGPRPVNLTAPAVSGRAQPGQTLSASSGTWGNAALSFEYEWQRCDALGLACTAIAGADAVTYTVSEADIGSTLRVAVVAGNAAGESEPAASAASALVSSSAPPENLAPPVLAGAARAGAQLSASPGTWAGVPVSFAYRWKRCTARATNCRSIASAKRASYTISSADVGRTLRVTVIASNSVGRSAPVTSAPSAVVTEPGGEPPVNVTPPQLSGVARLGQLLGASQGTWSGKPTSFSYRWERCSASGASCARIAGASAASYLLGALDVGGTVRVSVTAVNSAGSSAPARSAPSDVVTGSGIVSHYEYVFNDSGVSVYDVDHSFQQVESFTLPGTNRGIRGVMVSPVTHMLFVTYGGDGGGNGTGSVLAYDLVSKRVVWSVNLGTGIDSGAVSNNGGLLYVPDGELSADGNWYILDALTGALVGKIETPGAGPHNTVLSADGKTLLLGTRNYNYLFAYDTQTGKLRPGIGPLVGGVRPLTIDGSDSLAFTAATGFDGFQVESLGAPGRVLYTESFGPCSGPFTTCSHGVGLSPDSRLLYVVDSVRKAVQIWDVHGVGAGVAPAQLAVVPVAGLSGEEEGCAYDCGRDGWLQPTLDGRYVFVGDSGSVIETATNKVVATIPALLNTRKSVEIDWLAGLPIASSGRQGIGHP